MKFSRILITVAAATAALAAEAQVGPHGEVGGMPYGAEGRVPDQPTGPSWATTNPWSTSYSPLAFFRSSRTRAEVRAELEAGRRAMLEREGLAQPTGTGVAGTPRSAY